MSKIMLVIEGGGIRGIYAAGVLDAFMDAGLVFEDIAGVSAGACHAVSYMSWQRGRSLDILVRYGGDKRYVGLSGLFTRRSLFGMDFIFDDIPNRLLPFDYEAYQNSGMRLRAVVTDCDTGAARYPLVQDGRADMDYLRASASIPLFAQIVEKDGVKMLDGGAADSIPVAYARREGFDKQVVILTQAADYRKKPLRARGPIARKYRRYPNLVDTLCRRSQVYNETLDLCGKLEKSGEAILLRPSATPAVGWIERDASRIKALYQMGYDDAAKKLPEILAFAEDASNVRMKEAVRG